MFCVIWVNGDFPCERSSVYLLLLQCSCMISFTVLAITPNPLVHHTQWIQVVRYILYHNYFPDGQFGMRMIHWGNCSSGRLCKAKLTNKTNVRHTVSVTTVTLSEKTQQLLNLIFKIGFLGAVKQKILESSWRKALKILTTGLAKSRVVFFFTFGPGLWLATEYLHMYFQQRV